MQPITPLTVEAIRPHIGQPVCAILHDGSELVGTLHGVEDNRLLIRMEPETESAQTNSIQGKKKKRKPVRTAALAPIAYRGGLLALDLALIALLFLVPFLW